MELARAHTGPLTDTSWGGGVSSLLGWQGKQSHTRRNVGLAVKHTGIRTNYPLYLFQSGESGSALTADCSFSTIQTCLLENKAVSNCQKLFPAAGAASCAPLGLQLSPFQKHPDHLQTVASRSVRAQSDLQASEQLWLRALLKGTSVVVMMEELSFHFPHPSLCCRCRKLNRQAAGNELAPPSFNLNELSHHLV